MALPGVLVGLGAAGCVGRRGEQLVSMLEGVRTSRKVGNQWSRGRPHFLLFSLHRRDIEDVGDVVAFRHLHDADGVVT